MTEIKRKTLTLVGYVRISTQEQTTGYGLEYQQQAIQNYCENKGIKLTKVYSDIESGSKKNRPGLNQLMDELDKYDGVIVYHTDRLSRKLMHLLQIIETFGKKGKQIIATSQPELQPDNPTGKLVFMLLASVAEFELSCITQRLLMGRLTAKRKAEETNQNINWGKRPRYGEKKHWEMLPTGGIKKTLIRDEEEQKIIELIRRHRRSGKSFSEIAFFLNSHGLKYRQGNDWKGSKIKYLCS